MDKSVFLYWWFSFDLLFYLVLGGTNNVLHFWATTVFVHPVGSSTGEKILQNINNSCAQVASFQTTMHHMMSIYLIVRIQLSFVQFSLLCYEFCILWKTECKSIYYHFKRDRESSSFQKLARNKWICWKTCDVFIKFRLQKTTLFYFTGKGFPEKRPYSEDLEKHRNLKLHSNLNN